MLYNISIMNKALTKAQKRVIAAILDLSRKTGQSPTMEELRQALGLSSISSVQRHINALRKKGAVKSEKHQPRSLELSFKPDKIVNIPLVGNVACGVPLLAAQNIEAYIPYRKSDLKDNPKDYFFLKAIGDSMNASKPEINNGDYILVKKQNTAKSGDKVVVLIGDEATIKKLEANNNVIILKPESTNKQNKPIILFENPLIQGIVVNVIKKGGD
jgi:repressor LexA